jgi:hypothetical protein
MCRSAIRHVGLRQITELLQQMRDSLRILIGLLLRLAVAERSELAEEPHLLHLADEGLHVLAGTDLAVWLDCSRVCNGGLLPYQCVGLDLILILCNRAHVPVALITLASASVFLARPSPGCVATTYRRQPNERREALGELIAQLLDPSYSSVSKTALAEAAQQCRQDIRTDKRHRISRQRRHLCSGLLGLDSISSPQRK